MSARNVRNVNKVNSEKGSITLFTLIALTFMLIIAFTAYVSTMSKLNGQNAELEQIKSAYEQDINAESLAKLYNELTGTRGWLPGEGTQQNPYKIYTIEDLVEFSNRTNKNSGAESFEGKYVELMNTVDFNNVTTYENAERIDFGDVNGDGQVEGLRTELTTYEGFKPIGSKTSFKGIFKGNNNEIKNLYEDKKTLNILGLFANIKNATLQDFGVTGNITNTASADNNTYEGGITGNAGGNTIIKNVYNKVNVSCNFRSGYIGGITGNSNGTVLIEDSYNEGNITSGYYTGGFVGNKSNTIQIKNCYNTGEITNIQGSTYCAGFIPMNSGKTEIINSCNDGKITGTSYTGGIIGRGYSGEITIYNSGNKNLVQNTTGNEIGGIMAVANSNTNITNCYNIGEVISLASGSNLAAIVATNSGTIKNCYNNGEIKSNKGCNYISGIVGLNYGTIENSYNEGIIIMKSYGSQVGGISGRNANRAAIKNCYSVGNFEYEGVSYLGGINGYSYDSSTITNSYYLNTIASRGYNPSSKTGITNCTSKTEAEMKDATFVTLLDTDNEEQTWSADTTGINNGYPILKWQLQQ